ncbi:isoprenylcysteine carboxylmethyltransferase family protein [bacterium]|nr:isoprenylcysteine carboxylmethyltransferase family protein [bacterium]
MNSNNQRQVSRWLTVFSFSGTVLAVLSFLVPIILYRMSPPFFAKIIFTLVYIAVAIERFWFSCFTSRENNPIKVKQDWTLVTVGPAYVLMMNATIIEFYFLRSQTGIMLAPSLAGFTLFVFSFFLRQWSVKHLGVQWAIHLEGTEKRGRYIVQTGPYAFVRHPIYLAAMLEVLGIPLFFNSFSTLFLSCLLCIPLFIIRTYYEERNSLQVFGDDYVKYKEKTWAFWPLAKSGKSFRLFRK